MQLKKILIGFLATFFVGSISMGFASCSKDKGNSKDKKTTVSEGLELILNDDERSYSIVGMGICKDTELVLPATHKNLPVTRVWEGAFYDCDNLTSVVFSKNLIAIDWQAFYDCDSLTSVVIEGSIGDIGAEAFACCDSLTNLRIGEGVMTIGGGAFSMCPNLRYIVVSERNFHYKTKDGNLYTKDGKTLIQYAVGKEETSFTIPTGVARVGYAAFAYDDSLTTVSIPTSVEKIDAYAFYSCVKLTNLSLSENNQNYKLIDGDLYTNDGTVLVQYLLGKPQTMFTIPESVIAIGYGAMGNADQIQQVIIPDGVITIGESAFCSCDNLTSVDIGNGVEIIGAYAFSECESLTEMTIPENVMYLDNFAFYDCSNLTSIAVGDGVSVIGYGAFSYCEKLTNVTLGKGLFMIGSFAFTECTSLTSIKLPEGVMSLGEATFVGCTSLTSVELPISLTSVGEDAFLSCERLLSIYYAGTLSDWKKMVIASGNTKLTSATRYYYSENEPTESGNYWHYNDDGEIVIWE